MHKKSFSFVLVALQCRFVASRTEFCILLWRNRINKELLICLLLRLFSACGRVQTETAFEFGHYSSADCWHGSVRQINSVEPLFLVEGPEKGQPQGSVDFWVHCRHAAGHLCIFFRDLIQIVCVWKIQPKIHARQVSNTITIELTIGTPTSSAKLMSRCPIWPTHPWLNSVHTLNLARLPETIYPPGLPDTKGVWTLIWLSDLLMGVLRKMRCQWSTYHQIKWMNIFGNRVWVNK